MSQEFEARKNELLDDVRGVLKEAETLYQSAVDDGSVEAKELKAKLKIQLDKVFISFISTVIAYLPAQFIFQFSALKSIIILIF